MKHREIKSTNKSSSVASPIIDHNPVEISHLNIVHPSVITGTVERLRGVGVRAKG